MMGYLRICVHAQSCPTLCNPIRDCNPPGSSVHGIFQAKILEWVAISSSRRSSWPRDSTHISYVSCLGRRIPYHWDTWEDPGNLIPFYFDTLSTPLLGSQDKSQIRPQMNQRLQWRRSCHSKIWDPPWSLYRYKTQILALEIPQQSFRQKTVHFSRQLSKLFLYQQQNCVAYFIISKTH